MGIIYLIGDKTVQDLNKAEKYLRLAGSKNYSDAFKINDAIKKYEIGDASAASDIAIVYKKNKQLPNHLQKSFEWAMKGALAGDIDSIILVGQAYENGELGQQENHLEALRWFELAAKKESASAYYWLGMTYLFGNQTIRNSDKGEKYLTLAAKSGSNIANFILSYIYIRGYGEIKKDKEKGYSILKELRESTSPYYALDLESDLYLDGVDRPKNKQKAVLTSINAIKLEIESDGEDRINRTGPFSGSKSIEEALLELNLPAIYEVAWKKFYLGEKAKDDKAYKYMLSLLTQKEIEQSLEINFNTLLTKTIELIEKRRDIIGPIEASDLLYEGWKQYEGQNGRINEPLAQLLTEEALKVAIRSELIELDNGMKGYYKRIQDLARNNLGIILRDSANEYTRNKRLGLIHLYEGKDSVYGPDNLLWANYVGEIQLSNGEKANLLERYNRRESEDHLTSSLPEVPNNIRESHQEVIKFIIEQYKDGNDELADAIGNLFKRNAKSRDDYLQSLHWFKLAKNQTQINIVSKILSGNYEKSLPNFTGTLNQLFEVDLVDTRGALLTNLSSAFTPLRNTPLNIEKSKRKLNLHAIVIGNSAYKVKPLKNSANDAKAIANKFRSFGFEVTEVIDADRRKFRETLVNFSERSKNSDVTVFYYAGHGMQLGGINYLLPTDIDFSMPESVVTYDGLSLNDIKNRSLPGSTKLIFLDACRNNPFESTVRGNQSGGLAPVNVGTGTLISFATRDGSVALDSVGGQHSPYTQALLKHLDANEDVELMLRTVGDEVLRLTKNRQEPWKYGALSGQKVILPMLAK